MNHTVLEQTLHSFQCPPEALAALQRFNAELPWESVPRRGESNKAGRSYIHPSGSLQSVPELDSLHRWMEECLNEVRLAAGWRVDTVRGLAISQSWLNRSDIGELHHRHHHPLSLLSGILYLTEPSSTRFMAPSIWSLPRVLAPDKTTGNAEITSEFKGQIGQFIVFPSTLKHEVAPNLEPHARITLSVNSWFQGAIGRVEELAYVPENNSPSARL
jgi:hypothetical protein